ncbi:LysR substrate-binding domain-containing protein [Streptomyces sp. NPDC004752]
MSSTLVTPLRIGVHGSAAQAERIVAASGFDPARVTYVPYDVREPFRPLRAGELDVMLVKFPLREPDVVAGEPVAFDARAALLRAGHPLAGRDALSVEDLVPYDLFRRPGDFPAYVWDQVVPPRTPRGTVLRRVREMTTMAALAETLTGSDAVHLSFLSLRGIVPPQVRVVPVADLPPAPVSLAWLREGPPVAGLAEFVAAAERRAAR